MLMGKWVAGREREDGRRTLVTSASAVRSTSTLKSEWNTNGIDREDKRERKRERERERQRERLYNSMMISRIFIVSFNDDQCSLELQTDITLKNDANRS